MPKSVLKVVSTATGYIADVDNEVDKTVTNDSAPETAEAYITATTTQVAATIPSNTKFVQVSGPVGNTNNLRLSGATGASAAECLVLDPTRPSRLAVPSASPRLCVGAAASTANVRIATY